MPAYGNTSPSAAAAARWRALMQFLNEKRAEARDTLAYAIHNPGKGPVDDPGAQGLHESWMRGTAANLGRHVSPNVAYNLLDTVGRGNELLSGALSAAGGRGFYGEAGYDQEDIEANRRGMDAALKHDMPRRPPVDAIDPDKLARLFIARRRARSAF